MINQRDVAIATINALICEASAWHQMAALYIKLGKPAVVNDCLTKRDGIGVQIHALAEQHNIAFKEV